jgi:hypothetical protein
VAWIWVWPPLVLIGLVLVGRVAIAGARRRTTVASPLARLGRSWSPYRCGETDAEHPPHHKEEQRSPIKPVAWCPRQRVLPGFESATAGLAGDSVMLSRASTCGFRSPEIL